MNTAELGEVTITVEDTAPILVGRSAVEAIRADANYQADRSLREADEKWQELDVTDMGGLTEVAWALGRARDAVNALIHLAPAPDDDDEAS